MAKSSAVAPGDRRPLLEIQGSTAVAICNACIIFRVFVDAAISIAKVAEDDLKVLDEVLGARLPNGWSFQSMMKKFQNYHNKLSQQPIRIIGRKTI